MKKFFTIVIMAMMTFVSANAQYHFGIGVKSAWMFGEETMTPQFQLADEVKLAVFAVEASATLGVCYLSFEGIDSNGVSVQEQGFKTTADFDIYGKVFFSRFQGIVGVGYVCRQLMDINGYQMTGGNFNPEFYAVSGVKASAGLSASLFVNENTGERLDVKVLANFAPCMVLGQQVMKFGAEVGIIYYMSL